MEFMSQNGFDDHKPSVFGTSNVESTVCETICS